MKRSIVLLMLSPVCVMLAGYLAFAQAPPAADGLTFKLEINEQSQLTKQERQLEQSSRQLVRDYSRTEDQSKRAELQQELRKKVDEHFAVKQQIRAQELAELESRLRKLRTRHERRSDARSQIVEDRVKQLLRDADGLGWGAATGRSGWWSQFSTAPVVPNFGGQEYFWVPGGSSADAPVRPDPPSPPAAPAIRQR